MWQVLSILAFAGFCLALPAPQDPGSLDSLISNVFGPPSTTTKRPVDLDALISNVFGNGAQNTTSPGTILGTQNTPPPRLDNCECVPYYQCRDGAISTSGIGIIDLRSGLDDRYAQSQGGGGPCDNYLDVCCKPPNLVKDNEQKVTPKPVERIGCGQRHAEGVGFRITGQTDNEAQFGEFPWMVAILKEEAIGQNGQKLNVYQCGGSLIHRSAVLTAAHCVNGKKPSELRVRAGEWDTQTKNEIFAHQDRNVQNVIVHDKYNSGALYNDYAILILSEPVDYAENVDIACLPDRDVIFDGDRCFASGWGKDIFGKEGHYQVILKKVELPVMPRDMCQTNLRTTRLGKYFVLDESFICAGGERGRDTCKGDGGSPLVCPVKNDPRRYLQAGIVAWGIGCGEDGIPGVYANVAHVRDWIDEQMAFNNLDISVYRYTRA